MVLRSQLEPLTLPALVCRRETADHSQKTWRPELFHGFSYSVRVNSMVAHWLRRYFLLPNPFLFIVQRHHVIRCYVMIDMSSVVNLLKPTGHVMHQQFNIQQLYVPPTLYLCVLYLSENKQRLVPLTA
jgi:hypothetical protein